MTNPLLEKVLFVNHFLDDKNEETPAIPINKSGILLLDDFRGASVVKKIAHAARETRATLEQ
jgi:hypothetical protein